MIVFLPVLLCGCSQIENWRHPEIATCEDFVRSTLKSPSSYKRSKITVSDSRLPAAYWNEEAAKESPAMRRLLADVNKRRISEGGRRIVLVEYDADNSFGASLRGIGSCTFEMKSTANNELSSEPSATMAKADAALASAGMGSASEGCCESREKMTRLNKYEPQAQYISQQVFD